MCSCLPLPIAFNTKHTKFERTMLINSIFKEKKKKKKENNTEPKFVSVSISPPKKVGSEPLTDYLPSDFCNSSWDTLHRRWQGKTIAVSQRSPALLQVNWSWSGFWLDSQSHIHCKLTRKTIQSNNLKAPFSLPISRLLHVKRKACCLFAIQFRQTLKKD